MSLASLISLSARPSAEGSRGLDPWCVSRRPGSRAAPAGVSRVTDEWPAIGSGSGRGRAAARPPLALLLLGLQEALDQRGHVAAGLELGQELDRVDDHLDTLVGGRAEAVEQPIRGLPDVV